MRHYDARLDFMNKKILEIQGKEITVKKLSLRKIIALLDNLQELPKEITGLDSMSNDDIMQNVPMMVATLMPKFAKVVVQAVDDKNCTEEFLLDVCGLDDSIELVYTILEVNNLPKILDRVKKIRAFSQKTAKPTRPTK